MTAFHSQLEAIGSALLHIQKLSEGTVWSLICTNDDDAKAPSALNIYAPSEDWGRLADLLKLRVIDVNIPDEMLCFKQGTLYITFTEE